MTDINVTTVNADGTVEETSFDPGDEFRARLAEARAYWAELEAAGTPYWCVHKDRDLDHPAAYWQDDQATGIHRKHGVRCRDCGGYLQEG
jgi:hypothetical protein